MESNIKDFENCYSLTNRNCDKPELLDLPSPIDQSH